MSFDFEAFDDKCQETLDANQRIRDAFRLTEENVWSDLAVSIGDSRTEAEAQQEFMDWRTNARNIGEIAVRQ